MSEIHEVRRPLCTDLELHQEELLKPLGAVLEPLDSLPDFCCCPPPALLLGVMSFCVVSDDGGNSPIMADGVVEDTLDRICEVILRAAPDLVGLQGCSWASAERLGRTLGMRFAGAPDSDCPVLSRWPVEVAGPRLAAGQGYRTWLPDGQELLWFNVRLRARPYPPHVLFDPLPYFVRGLLDAPGAVDKDQARRVLAEDEKGGPIAKALEACLGDGSPDGAALATAIERRTQLPALLEVLDEMLKLRAEGGSDLTLLTGDFSAASHADYPAGPAWPCSLECASRGLIDSFDEARRLGLASRFPATTWAAKEGEEQLGVQDRIDFVYHSQGLRVEWSGHLDGSNSGVPAWPSSHRAVLSVLSVSPPLTHERGRCHTWPF